jgi:hypothetical protein
LNQKTFARIFISARLYQNNGECYQHYDHKPTTTTQLVVGIFYLQIVVQVREIYGFSDGAQPVL